MQNLRKLIYLPVETKSREFDSKCLIALACAEKGAAVILSAMGRSRMEIPGVILLKSAAAFELPSILAMKKKHFKCTVIDEEGFVQTRNEKQRALRYSQGTIDAVDQIFFNGSRERELLSTVYALPADKGIVTGNPRFDFYKPRFRSYYQKHASKLQKRHGRYILLPSRFGNVTPARKVGYLDFLKKTRQIEAESDLDIFRAFFEHSKKIYRAFLDLLPRLSEEFSQYTIVIRPHPSESKEAWLAAAAGHRNVKVIAEGPIGPWLLGADAVLHNGCTTGLEAFLMDRPVFSYMPYTSEEFDLKLPNNLSIQRYDEKSLFEDMKSTLALNEAVVTDTEKIAYAESFLHNAGSHYAYEDISDELVAMTSDMTAVDVQSLAQPKIARIKGKLLKIVGRLAVRAYHYGLRLPENIVNYGYAIKKNPGFSFHELRGNLDTLADLAGVKPEDIAIEKLDEDKFIIYKR